MLEGKRKREREKRKKRIKCFLNFFLIISVLFVFIWLILEEKKETKNMFLSKENPSIEIDTAAIGVAKEYPKVAVQRKYKDYPVIAKLEIPIISLESYILSEYSTKALKISATKFWGDNPNETGNFCIAGHNYKRIFGNLKKLKIGDKLFLSDNEIGKVEYEIYDMDITMPDDVSCLKEDFDNQKQITLITCTNDSQKRLVIKAREFIEKN